jgi:hypothetical protein
MSETLVLLTAIPLLAAGAVFVSDSVHSRLDSIALRIGGLMKKFSNTGFCADRKNPRIALAQKIPVANRIGRVASRTRKGHVSRQNSVQLVDLARPA